MNILVTGGEGFVGKKLVEALRKEGHSVSVMDIAFGGDVTNAEMCKDFCKGMNVIYHLAALKSVPESFSMPLEYNRVNVDGTVKMLEAARYHTVPKFIFASSSAVYGREDGADYPIIESLKLRPISPYAVTKLAAEQYCRAYSYNYGMRTIALRFFNIYGPGQCLNDGYAGVISKFVYAMVKGERPKIWGDGKQVRDFIYIDDVIQALLIAKEPLRTSLPHEFGEFNIGSGRGKNLLEIIDIANKELQLVQKPIEPEFFPAQEGDIRTSVADIRKAEMYLGWKPETKFPNGLLNTIKHFQGYQVIKG